MQGVNITVLDNAHLLSFNEKGKPEFKMGFSQNILENNVCYYNRNTDSIIQVNSDIIFYSLLDDYELFTLDQLFYEKEIIDIIKNVALSEYDFYLTSIASVYGEWDEGLDYVYTNEDMTKEEFNAKSEFEISSLNYTNATINLGTATIYLSKSGTIQVLPHSRIKPEEKDYFDILSLLSNFIPRLKEVIKLEKIEMFEIESNIEAVDYN